MNRASPIVADARRISAGDHTKKESDMVRAGFIVAVAFLAAAAAIPAPSRTVSTKRMPPGYSEAADIANSKDLSKEEKIAKLKELAVRDATQRPALYQLDRLDRGEATKTAIALFRAKGASRETKLRLGHFALEAGRPQGADFPQEFMKECADSLIGAVLNGGEKEFCQALPEHPITAVGEYAYLASDFDGYKGVEFAPFKDARLVPVLVRCLDAPDNVWAKDQGDCIRGKPGESTGRNTARQQIPVALAKLGDEQAIEPLKRVLSNHKDFYERRNAAYALARLLEKKEDRAAIRKALLAKPELLPFRFSFGKGLIEIGDDDGVELLAFKHSIYYDKTGASEVTYMAAERLEILTGFKSPKIEVFIRDVLAYKPLRAMLLFEPDSVRINPADYGNRPNDEAEARQRYAARIVELYGMMLGCVALNDLKGLSADLAEIGKETRSEKIRAMTNACLKSLGR